MNEVSLFRLYVLRAAYLLIAVGLCVQVWPGVISTAIHPDQGWELMEGVVQCMLAAFAVLCLLGVRYPLQMLPILLWELLWKSLWLLIVALPAWANGQMDESVWATTFACLLVVIVPIAMPWRYFVDKYMLRSGDRWRKEA
ncbi:CHASE2 domain-containing sensor protein [Paenibacillus phyllosphaerae]|uniref:CHASE2 domain-containing sensor protein n=1 Tax=Paenibacillus phyllosphaerae TaxID=274593 RepID=A0A7W5AXP5_9BACL|nr:hypothetical protein [Paenibacillus phyllosphaerae]MBB3110061.1 CHASE2 domain-containing sensor protein [Paenibacillus phyllosphaerae]